MKIAMFRQEATHGIGVVDGDNLIDFSRAFYLFCSEVKHEPWPLIDNIKVLLEQGLFHKDTFMATLDFLKEHERMDEFTIGDGFSIAAPIRRPGKIVGIGLNFRGKGREEKPSEPLMFIKAGTTVADPGQNLSFPEFVPSLIPEAELAVVVGKTAKNVAQDEAEEYVAGYSIANDITGRGEVDADGNTKGWKGPENVWFNAKNLDGSTPLGPYVVTKGEVESPIERDILFRVNGKVTQQENTRNLRFSVPECISHISRYATLEPGDVICMGTPGGYKAMRLGDEMEAEIQGIGVLKNRVIGHGDAER